jgi:phosphoglucosamine mutase
VSFGTDGVRGVANDHITVELALALGRASVRVFGAERVVVGRDTRRSGPMLEAAVVAGICAEGAEAVPLGVVPTPAVAHATASASGPRTAGVVISASHNPFADNGLKIFAPGGRKLTDAEQHLVEDVLAGMLEGGTHAGPIGPAVGVPGTHPEAVQAYADSVVAAIGGRDLAGMRLVVDCANGANSTIGPEVLRRLGADVTTLADAPDGTNINHGCGSTHPEVLSAAVPAAGADAGIAFDGDADRLVAVDHLGRVVDGDRIIAMCAVDLQRRGLLRNHTVVVTVMSNLGLRTAMAEAGITVVDTAVGDRYVLEALDAGGHSLGGEQSGHLIFRELSTTGDGLLSAVVLLDLVRRSGRTLAELSEESMTRLPQVLRNVPVAAPMPDVAERLAGPIAAVQDRLGDAGRVLLRPSGTEPVVRVMAEAPTEGEAAEAVAELSRAVESLAGA